jgi:hypothetical protein
MLNRIYIGIAGLIILEGCGGSSDAGNQNPDPSISNKAIPIYNQAYQENYQVDSIDDIITNAKDAYVLIDPFEDDTFQYVSQIKAKGNQLAGYISVGTGENWREDFDALKPYLTDKVWPQWPGEYFVNETMTGIVDVMKERIDKMATWGLEWVEFDNMDWLDEETRITYNLQATVQEAKAYINTLCDYTHEKDMKCMAKNTVDGFENFDGVLYESYNDNKNWWDVEGTRAFLEAGKLVIINHYNESDCNTVYDEYKSFYNSSETISFICEDINLEKYRHYNE